MYVLKMCFVYSFEFCVRFVHSFFLSAFQYVSNEVIHLVFECIFVCESVSYACDVFVADLE